MHLFRIMQELVNNVIKHSHARELHVSFEGYGPTVYRLIVTDNGRGFDTSRQFEGHYGIENIHRRAAAIGAVLLLDSRSQGTRVVLQRGMSEENNTFALLDGEVRVTNIAD
jgi:two-component system nitrate/nitrite sensor histidine kinase NarQ